MYALIPLSPESEPNAYSFLESVLDEYGFQIIFPKDEIDLIRHVGFQVEGDEKYRKITEQLDEIEDRHDGYNARIEGVSSSLSYSDRLKMELMVNISRSLEKMALFSV